MDIIRLTCFVTTLTLIGQTPARAESSPRQRYISVPRGSYTYIRPADLGFDFHPDPSVAAGFYCVISVVNDDPGSLRVGRVYPEVFRCDFHERIVRYFHNGNPLLESDRVHLIVRQATDSETYVDEIVLSVRITPPADKVFITSRSSISFPPSELHVDLHASPLSGIIDSQVLRFRYNFTDGAICTLTYSNRQPIFFRSQALVSGSLVAPDGMTIVDNLSIDCRDFITSGYRYKLSDRWNSTGTASLIDVDYLPLSVEVEHFMNHTSNDQLPDRGIITETMFLPVHISTGIPNRPPKIETPRDWSASKGDVPIVWIDQYSSLILTSDLLSAVDDETPASDLVYSISRQTTNQKEGYFVDIRSDSWKPIWSFRQSDLAEGQIAYQPVSLEPAIDRIVDVELTVADGRFASSNPMRFRIGLRRAEPTSPKITQNTGLVVGRGQSRRIGVDQLRVYDSSGRSDWVQIHVLRGGPRHGTFKVCGRVSDVFNASNLERREVVYEHNGEQDEQDEDDSVLLRISNFKYSSRTKFHISIISSSWWTGHRRQRHLSDGIATNVATEVRQNGYAQITTLHAQAGYPQATADTFLYEVVQAPQYGEILMMFRPMTKGRRSSKFTQLDLDRGHIWYHHMAINKSAATSQDYFRFVLRSTIDREGADDVIDGPEIVLRHEIVVRLHDFDQAPRPSRSSLQSLNVSVSTSLVTIGSNNLLYIDGENPGDDVLYVVTCQPYFVQSANADYEHVSYDAGQLVYYDRPISTRAYMSDNVTLTPFPILRTFTQSMINSELVSYQLPPITPPYIDRQNTIQVRFIFSVSDLHGNFAVDQVFDIHLLPPMTSPPSSTKSKPPMQPRTSASTEDNVDLASMHVVDVNEGDTVVIGLKHLAHKLNEGEVSDAAVFDIIKHPLDGVILVNGRKARSFTMSDLRAGSVQYQHTGGETGQMRRTDSVSMGVVTTGDELSFIDVDLVIRPVDNSPPELTVGGLLVIGVNQLTVPLTSEAVTAFDVDTDPDQLMFVVVETPAFGRLDVVMSRPTSGQTTNETSQGFDSVTSTRRGRSSSSSNRRSSGRVGVISKRSVTAFSMSELRSRAVRYVRRSNISSSLRSSLFDSFKVYASDGERRSAVGQVEIALQSSPTLFDEFQVEQSIEVEEGGDRVFKIHLQNKTSNKLSALDPSSSDLVITLVSPPRHGKVLISVKSGQIVTEVNLDAVAVSDLYNPNLRTIYRHDGRLSNCTDEFSLAASGAGRQFTVKTVRVDVHPRDRLTPLLLLANKLTVRGRNGRAFITRSHLMAEHSDSPDNTIRYRVMVPPVRGRLERFNNSSSTSVNITETIEKGDSFSQAEINASLISYVASSDEVQYEDSFVFQLTEGRNPSSFTGTLDIEIIAERDTARILPECTSSPGEDKIQQITVTDGFRTYLTNEVLGLPLKGVQDPIFLRITSQPRRGLVSIELNESTSVQSVTMFAQLDVEAGRVFYRLLDNVQGSDTMDYQLEDANGNVICPIRQLHINIETQSGDMNSLPPTPTLDVNVPLTVIHGYRATLTASNLHMSVPLLMSASYQLVYSVVEPPKHGQILKRGLVLSENGEETRTFTQKDIDSGLVEYKSDSSDESMMDYFLFSIGIIYNASHTAEISSSQSAEQKPLFFSILIQPVTKISPKVVHREPPHHLVRLDESSTGSNAAAGTRFGFIFTPDNLKAVHPLFDARDIIYQLKTRPQNGYLEHLGSRRQIRRKFTQRDVDERRIVYVLNERTRMTNDSFTYRIVDLNRNAVDDQSMQLEWSMIQFGQSQYIVCEDAQHLSVSVHRTGAINLTVAVDVRLKSLTAKEPMDFRNKSVGTVEFAPGTREVSWMVEIVNDGLHEGNDEKFKILLENPANSILGAIDKIQVHLIDFEDGKCMEYIGMITKTHPSHSPMTVTNKRLPKGDHRQVAFNRQANGFRELNAGKELETESNQDDLSESDYLDKDNGDTPSGLLSSDLAFYMPPDPGSSSSSSIDSMRKNKKPKNGVSSVSTKQTKGLSSDHKLAIPQPCSRETQGLLFYDLESSKMYRCTGQRWEHWGWGLTGATEAPPQTRGRQHPGSTRGEVRTARHNAGNIDKETCLKNWTLEGDTCYAVIAERVTWIEAERRCQSLGGHVTGIASWQHLRRLSSLAGQRQFWTGMHSEPIENTHDTIKSDARRWINADGSLAAYFNWRSAPSEDNYCSDCNCVAVVGRQLQYVIRPCGGAHRVRAICAARRQRAASFRRRKQSNDGRMPH